jgi:hypothetical protein
MDDFEAQELIEDLERRVDQLSVTVNSFINGFDGKIQNQLSELIGLMPENTGGDNSYVIKLLGGLAYGQSCIIQNKKEIIRLLGGRNVSFRGMSNEEKQRRGEKLLNELQDPFEKGKSYGN